MINKDKRFLWLTLNHNYISICLHFSDLYFINNNKLYVIFFFMILVKKKKAPLMQKALQLIKSTRRR